MASITLYDSALSYPDKKHDSIIFESLSLEFNPGEIVGILGPNGSGKSSLIKTILGHVDITKGSIKFNSRNDRPPISYIPQDFSSSFFNGLSLNNNLRLSYSNLLKKRQRIGEKIKRLQEELGTELNLKLMPRQCSGGMLQQAAILRSFINDNTVILADEPFSALDISISREIRKSFRKKIINSNMTAIVILHDLEDMVSVCDKILVIPNKPYSSNKTKGFNRVEFFKNDKVQLERNEGDFSLLDIATDFFS